MPVFEKFPKGSHAARRQSKEEQHKGTNKQFDNSLSSK